MPLYAPLRAYGWIVLTILAMFTLYHALKLVYVICDALLPTYPVIGAPRGLEVFIQMTLIVWTLYAIKIWVLIEVELTTYRLNKLDRAFAQLNRDRHESID